VTFHNVFSFVVVGCKTAPIHEANGPYIYGCLLLPFQNIVDTIFKLRSCENVCTNSALTVHLA
jgi:hypothetical protein